MQKLRTRIDYEIADRELVAEGADLRVQVLTLAAGQCVPWHYHSEVADIFACLEGPMVVETRAPKNDCPDNGALSRPGRLTMCTARRMDPASF